MVRLEQFEEWMRVFAARVHESRDRLTELDSAIGDADHGANMDRGMSAVVEAISPEALAESGKALDSVADLFKLVGMTLVSKVGGAAGPLYGSFFLRFAAGTGEGKTLTEQQVVESFQRGLEKVLSRGKAELGDKTLVDALAPAVVALREAVNAGDDFSDALVQAARGAREGCEQTIEMLAKKGRASYLGERSVGHQDPGATSMAMLVQAAADTLAP